MQIHLKTLYAIPGFGFDASIFKGLALENQLAITGLNYRQHNLSALETISHAVAAKLPHESTLLGWSLGGLIAIQIAANFPHKVKQLILIASQPKLLADASTGWRGIPQTFVTDFFEQLIKNQGAQMKRFYRLVAYPQKIHALLNTHATSYASEQAAALLSMLMETDLRAVYSNLTQPILHITHLKDAVTPPNTQALKALRPETTHIALQTGHAGFLSQAAAYRHELIQWISHAEQSEI